MWLDPWPAQGPVSCATGRCRSPRMRPRCSLRRGAHRDSGRFSSREERAMEPDEPEPSQSTCCVAGSRLTRKRPRFGNLNTRSSASFVSSKCFHGPLLHELLGDLHHVLGLDHRYIGDAGELAVDPHPRGDPAFMWRSEPSAADRRRSNESRSDRSIPTASRNSRKVAIHE